MAGYAINAEQGKRLNTALKDLMVLAEADGVFMADHGGNLIAHNTPAQDDMIIQTMAALGAGSFIATRELAGLIGEEEFRSMFHQGEKSSIYVQSIAANFLLLVIFGRSTPVGLVKLHVERAAEVIAPILTEIDGQSVADAGNAQTFEINQDSKLFGG